MIVTTFSILRDSCKGADLLQTKNHQLMGHAKIVWMWMCCINLTDSLIKIGLLGKRDLLGKRGLLGKYGQP